MIARKKRINALIQLGNYLNDPTNSIEIEECVAKARASNSWFTPEHTRLSIASICRYYLDQASLNQFAERYGDTKEIKKIGVVMAGNVPAVGFHDALCVILSGHHLLAKLSKDDYALMFFLLNKLISIEPELAKSITFVDRINEADAYIATGSDNSARYFTYYFANKPHIIRKNRTSVAVLTGNETTEELSLLGDDILLYFGLGCRNISKMYVPAGYDFSGLYESLENKRFQYANHHKYFNNYEYNRSILLVNGTEHFDNGFLIFTKNEALVSPLTVVYYENYNSLEELTAILEAQAEKIQCVVGRTELIKEAVPFGAAQYPGLEDFADGVDTMSFLGKL